ASLLLALILGGAISARAQEVDTGVRERHSGDHAGERHAAHQNKHKHTPASTPGADAQILWKNTGTNFNDANSWNPAAIPGTADVAAFSGAQVTAPALSLATTIVGLYFKGTTATGYTFNSNGGNTLAITLKIGRAHV